MSILKISISGEIKTASVASDGIILISAEGASFNIESDTAVNVTAPSITINGNTTINGHLTVTDGISGSLDQ